MTKQPWPKSWGFCFTTSKRPAIDEEVKRQIEAVLTDNPFTDIKRIVPLKLNKKRILRVMKNLA